ncbi:uncharacterized protein LOC129941065 [Eupeodes corollae]|uniref:uncharacterized protein LOC129941065 n=1 Tax=Eupeodes corollae TaxID=290404 RepID=UPI002491938E|nr:uncharacterized protein LOC129941065 [Eupeodes corollae]
MSTTKNNSLDKHEDLKTNIKFLKLIEKHECLWKHDSPNYTNNHIKVEAWKQIAKAVNGTEERCNRRWRYIRQAYSQHVRTSINADPKKKYYLSPHVDFVKPYIKLHPCCQSSATASKQNKDNSKEDWTETTKRKHTNEAPAETEKILEQQFLELIEGKGEKSTKTKSVEVYEERKLKPSTSSCSLKRKIDIQDTESRSKHVRTTEVESVVSKNWMFLESILPFVDEMSKKQIRRFRKKVMLLLEDVLEKKSIDRPELVK